MTAVAHQHTAGELTEWTPAMILAEAARLEENAIKDKTYEQTPIGAIVRRYLDELTFDNYSPRTVQGREYILARLALRFAHRELRDLTYDDLRDFLAGWKDAAANTRAVYVSTIKTFCQWAEDHDLVPRTPAGKLRGPRQKDTDRVAHSPGDFRKLVAGQPLERDKVALLILYWCGLRRNEIRLVQFQHIDLFERTLVIVGAKGGTAQTQNIPEQLAAPLTDYMLRRMPEGREFLLHPMRIGRYGTYPDYQPDVIWQDKHRALSMSGIDKWWQRCCERAGMTLFPMHELRHTAGTEFHKASGDLYATQHFMRHKSPATTARVYVHLDVQRTVADVQKRMRDPMEVTNATDRD